MCTKVVYKNGENKNIILSFVVPFYNTDESMFTDLVNNIISNKIPGNIEFVFVNDGSTSLIAYEEIIHRLDNVTYIVIDDNVGVSRARNIGIDACGGKYISFIDSDDLIDFDALFLLNVLTCDFDLLILKQGVFFSDKGFDFPNSYNTSLDTISYQSCRSMYCDYMHINRETTPYAMRSGCSKVFLTKKVKGIIYFDENLKTYEDSLFVSMYIHGLNTSSKILISSNVFYYYRMNPKSASKRYNKLFVQEFNKYFNTYSQLFFLDEEFMRPLYLDSIFNVLINKFTEYCKKFHFISALNLIKSDWSRKSSLKIKEMNTLFFDSYKNVCILIAEERFFSAFMFLFLHRLNQSFCLKIRRLIR